MKTILFADDNKNIREYCRVTFEDEGYRVVLARDGLQAFQLFCAEMPDIAVLDISMPRAGGLDALQQIKSVRPETPVILFTAHDEDCLRDRRAALASACVEKCEDLGELKQVVASILKTPCWEAQGGPGRLGLPPMRGKIECS